MCGVPAAVPNLAASQFVLIHIVAATNMGKLVRVESSPPGAPPRLESPRNIHVAATASPRLVSAAYPRRSRGV